MSNLGSFQFWEMFHSLLRHGDKPADVERAKDVYIWFGDNIHLFRKIIKDPIEVALIGVLWDLATPGKEMPGYAFIKSQVEGMQQNAGIVAHLEEYEESKSGLEIYDVPTLPNLLRALADKKEKEHVEHLAKCMERINGTGWEDPKTKKKLQGPREAVTFMVKEMEKGILVDTRNANYSVDVKGEAEHIVADYEEMQNSKQFYTGTDRVKLREDSFLGVLGYKGGGKSTFCRYTAYNIAFQGNTVLHVTLETDPRAEFRKYVMLHSQNPKFNGDFTRLNWRDWVDLKMSKRDLDAMDFVGKDFHRTFGGRLIVKKPSTDTWGITRSMIESTAMSTPIDVVLLDYIQLLNPPDGSNDSERTRRGEMIKDVRQFGLNFTPSQKLAILSPVQANEAGLKYATEHEGRWPLNAVNNDKELSASMTEVIGIFDQGVSDNKRILILSCAKDRERGLFTPESYELHPAGWCKFGSAREYDLQKAVRTTEAYAGTVISGYKGEL
jgi:hypothetical protein